jgi:hypothetical protein
VVVVGISLDEELKPLQEMVTAQGISWPQIHDGDQTLVKLFQFERNTYLLLAGPRGEDRG